MSIDDEEKYRTKRIAGASALAGVFVGFLLAIGCISLSVVALVFSICA